MNDYLLELQDIDDKLAKLLEEEKKQAGLLNDIIKELKEINSHLFHLTMNE